MSSLLTGRRLGVYHLQERIGAGGMGEARVLASLNHPNIGAIYGFEEGPASGPADAGHHVGEQILALVLELVEGETLAERIARVGGVRRAGPSPPGGPAGEAGSKGPGLCTEEALAIARQIADALEAAHEKGIVHRDLKPANIKLTLDGVVKVLDFGLAKVREVEGGSLDVSNSPTMMTTTPGMILGTAPYMSPEQANGRDADRTSDVWAFGCVLYEMLTRRRAFDGDTVGEILASVLKTEPDWHRLPAETPDGIRRLLRRCLQKDQKLRFHDIRDARLEIDDVQSGTQQNEHVAEVPTGRQERLAWASALALVVLMAAVLGVRTLRPAPAAPEARLEITRLRAGIHRWRFHPMD